MQVLTVDVKGKILGRAASEVAILLRGKNRADFEPRIRPTHKVKIENVDKLKVSGNKFREKIYMRYSGFPSGLRRLTMEEVFMKNPEEIFKRAVWGMLPNNKSRKFIIRNLIFK
ncbi:50S ribosomal protein L13 [Candidatus Giovannonibacteria bacterium]|nr:50S ribosomal protein L13 [Candidatus Giovannonibacteria bacterium]